MYIIQIKNFFKRINISKSYKKQILNHNVEKFSLMIKANLNMFASAKILIWANQNAELQINSVSSRKKNIKDLKQHFGKDERQRLEYSYLSTNYNCFAETAPNKAGVLGLMDTLVVFIKQKQAKIKEVKSMCNKHHRNNNNSS